MVIAVNKMDRPGADPQRVLIELMAYDVLPEEVGLAPCVSH
jgi:translation initiation factor IF-2